MAHVASRPSSLSSSESESVSQSASTAGGLNRSDSFQFYQNRSAGKSESVRVIPSPCKAAATSGESGWARVHWLMCAAPCPSSPSINCLPPARFGRGIGAAVVALAVESGTGHSGAALLTTMVREQHPRPQHKGAATVLQVLQACVTSSIASTIHWRIWMHLCIISACSSV